MNNKKTPTQRPVVLDTPTDLWWTRHFQVVGPTTTSLQPQQNQNQQQQQPAIPPEFPGVVYDVLRAFPDAMAAVDKAAQEFYACRVPR